MNATQIKTRHGLILQGITAAALTEAGFSFESDVQYDPTCERPDFLIPNSKMPRYMVEVHQTDVRNSLAMKTLRAFVAVAEAKATYGPGLVSVNLVFGDPDEDFSSSPLRALSAIYDSNIFPAREASAKKALQRLEVASLGLAADPEFTTKQAIEAVCANNASAITVFAVTLKNAIERATANENLMPMWRAEKARQEALGQAPLAGSPTYYKRTMLGALFFSDAGFESLLHGARSGQWTSAVVDQLQCTGLGEVVEEIDGDSVQLNPEFLAYLKDPQASHLRELCREVLDSVPEMHWFFEDIRDGARRLGMCRVFLRALRAGKQAFIRELQASLLSEKHRGYSHLRGWFIDLSALATSRSFNHYNKAIFQDPRYPLSLWNAFSNLAIRSPAMIRHQSRLTTLCQIVGDKVYDAFAESGVALADLSEPDLARRLLEFRVASAIKLRKLNPLLIVVTNIAAEYGLKVTRRSIDTLLFDLAEDSGVGRFLVFLLSHPRTGKSLLLSVVAVHEGNGDHKSKEWGARRIASLYRFRDGMIKSSDLMEGLFVIDGEWENKDVARLHRSGWTTVCRLRDLDAKLKQTFGLQRKLRLDQKPVPLVVMDDDSGDAQ
jgi:hypothetical protein